MTAELAELRSQLIELERHCVERYEGFPEKPWISRLVLKSGHAQRMCQHFAAGEVKFGEDMRYRQRQYMRTFRLERQTKPKQLIEEMQGIQRKILGQNYLTR